MDYERYFYEVKERVATDLDRFLPTDRLSFLTLSLNYRRTREDSQDYYRSQAAKVPAYYNPNSHSIHLNMPVLRRVERPIIENIYYHELIHASSHHAKVTRDGQSFLKSGLKLQQHRGTQHRGLNEGLTQYIANTYTTGGPAYRREVGIVGQLTRKVGLKPLTAAYFSFAIDELEQYIDVAYGPGFFQKLSLLVDQKAYDTAEALL